jgi:hypothetical protein
MLVEAVVAAPVALESVQAAGLVLVTVAPGNWLQLKKYTRPPGAIASCEEFGATDFMSRMMFWEPATPVFQIIIWNDVLLAVRLENGATVLPVAGTLIVLGARKEAPALTRLVKVSVGEGLFVPPAVLSWRVTDRFVCIAIGLGWEARGWEANCADLLWFALQAYPPPC